MGNCATLNRNVGDLLVLCSAPSGTPSYTITFQKGTLVLSSITTNGANTYFYFFVDADIGTQSFPMTVTDSCSPPNVCNDICYISVFPRNSPHQLINNPGFEIPNGTNTAPAYWQEYYSGTQPNPFGYDTSCTRPGGNGTRCLSINFTTADPTYSVTCLQTVYGIDPTKSYTFSAWLQTQNFSGDAEIQIQWYNGNTYNGLTMLTSQSGNTNGWINPSKIITSVPLSTTNAHIYLKVGTNSVGKVIFDDLSLILTVNCVVPNPNLTIP